MPNSAHIKKLVSLQKQLKTLKRKCIKLQSAKRVLKQEVKALTQRLQKAEQIVKTTNIELLLVTSVLRYLQRYGTQFGIFGFEDCLPTIKFMELVYKWFSLHNICSSTFHIFSKDLMRMPFYDSNDERWNTSHTIGTLGDRKKLVSTASSTVSSPVGLVDILRPYIHALEMLPGTPQPGLQASTLNLVVGFLVRAVQDKISCPGCLDTVKAPASSSPTTALIVNIDRGGLSYPRLSFVGFVINLERAASTSVIALLKSRRPVQQFLGAVLPAVCRNPLLQCEHDSSEDHRRALATVIVRKFTRSFLVNHTRNVSERKWKKKNLKVKPESRKVLKV
ncbi:uncharacterized protein ISCGN_021331 [Ixodes scapularis]